MIIRNRFKILTILVFMGFSTIAQNESYLGLCLGAAIPQGDYADKDYYVDEAGYANTGD